ncbi:MAG TPA: hypothetical protein VEU75_00585, partial [Candidatus Acidoferrum sp.]|nr:hypothetical protein [Candidatus Acidoferrum sp.]
VRALNSLLFIKDTRTKDLPMIDGYGSIWTTSSCVAVSCLPDCDGSTEVVIGNPSDLQNTAGKLLFDAVLETPNKCVSVETVLAEKILEKDVPNATTHVRIWTDGFRDTSKVVISLE